MAGTIGSTTRGTLRAGGCALLALGTLGCVADPPVAFDSPSPQRRMDAIARASDAQDGESLARLVEKLGSTDPAERMLAIRALERREGTTLGYDHAAPKWERIEAVQRWRERLGLDGDGGGDAGGDAGDGLSDGDGAGGADDPMSGIDHEGGTLADAAGGTDTQDAFAQDACPQDVLRAP